jgi:cysteine synthase
VTDEEALPLIFDLLKQEGFCMGGSTAINIGGKCLDLFKNGHFIWIFNAV